MTSAQGTSCGLYPLSLPSSCFPIASSYCVDCPYNISAVCSVEGKSAHPGKLIRTLKSIPLFSSPDTGDSRTSQAYILDAEQLLPLPSVELGPLPCLPFDPSSCGGVHDPGTPASVLPRSLAIPRTRTMAPNRARHRTHLTPGARAFAADDTYDAPADTLAFSAAGASPSSTPLAALCRSCSLWEAVSLVSAIAWLLICLSA